MKRIILTSVSLFISFGAIAEPALPVVRHLIATAVYQIAGYTAATPDIYYGLQNVAVEIVGIYENNLCGPSAQDLALQFAHAVRNGKTERVSVSLAVASRNAGAVCASYSERSSFRARLALPLDPQVDAYELTFPLQSVHGATPKPAVWKFTRDAQGHWKTETDVHEMSGDEIALFGAKQFLTNAVYEPLTVTAVSEPYKLSETLHYGQNVPQEKYRGKVNGGSVGYQIDVDARGAQCAALNKNTPLAQYGDVLRSGGALYPFYSIPKIDDTRDNPGVIPEWGAIPAYVQCTDTAKTYRLNDTLYASIPYQNLSAKQTILSGSDLKVSATVEGTFNPQTYTWDGPKLVK